MKRKRSLMISCSLLAFASLLGSSATYSADLTGSYEGTISCTLQALLSAGGGTNRTTIPAKAYLTLDRDIEETGRALYLMHFVYGYEAPGPGYKASHWVTALDTSGPSESSSLQNGMFTAVQCGTGLGGQIEVSIANGYSEFGVGDFKVLPNGSTTIDLAYYRNLGHQSDCKLNLTRIDITDPIVSLEGTTGSVPAYSCLPY